MVLVRRISAQEAAEDALRVSERRFDQALEGVRDAVWEWDLASDEVFLSPVWDRIVGRAADRPVRMASVIAEIHPDDMARSRAAKVAHRGGTPGADDLR